LYTAGQRGVVSEGWLDPSLHPSGLPRYSYSMPPKFKGPQEYKPHLASPSLAAEQKRSNELKQSLGLEEGTSEDEFTATTSGTETSDSDHEDVVPFAEYEELQKKYKKTLDYAKKAANLYKEQKEEFEKLEGHCKRQDQLMKVQAASFTKQYKSLVRTAISPNQRPFIYSLLKIASSTGRDQEYRTAKLAGQGG